MIYTYYKGEKLEQELLDAISYGNEALGRIGVYTDGLGWLAGGAMRAFFTGQKPNDFDYFFKCESDLVNAAITLDRNPKLTAVWTEQEKRMQYALDYVASDGTKIQLVNRAWYSSLDEVLESFDFTVCMCGVSHDQIAYDSRFFPALNKRLIELNSFESPKQALWRLQRYAEKGFRMDDDEMQKLIDRIVVWET